MSNKEDEWKIKPADCCAAQLNEDGTEKNVDLEGLVCFKDEDEFFSNQGPSALCARHAVAKAVLCFWRSRLGRRHPMKLQKLIDFLVT